MAVIFIAGCTSATALPPANAQSCAEIQDGIRKISSEIKEIQLQEIGDNSAPRATMRAARMSFGATAQANLLALGKSIGCSSSGLNLPLSIEHSSDTPGADAL